MCGRFELSTGAESLTDMFGVRWGDLVHKERFNVAPTNQVLVLGSTGEPAHAEYMRWGLIPLWKKPEQKLPLNINARAETVATSGMFNRAFKRQRCLIPASGFFEWETKVKPFRIGMMDWEPFAFAGIWDHWFGEHGEVRSCAIITTRPNEIVAPIHDRMPVILGRDAWGPWLDHSLEGGDDLVALLSPFPAEDMAMYEVSPLVNKVRNDVPEVINPTVSEG